MSKLATALWFVAAALALSAGAVGFVRSGEVPWVIAAAGIFLLAMGFGSWSRNARGSRPDNSDARPMRSTDEFVYVNQDGSVRELSLDEREYLSSKFSPGDSARPYIKSSYKSKDGWGSISGFLPRTRVPRHIALEPVNPNYLPPAIDARRELIEDGELVGDIITENADGSVTCRPDPRLPLERRFELLRQAQLKRQREREDLAKHPDHVERKQT